MSTVLYEPKGAVVRITLNRPQAMNAFDLPTARELGRRLEEFDKDDALRVAIVTGAGDKSFCAGADLKQMHGGSHAGGVGELWGSEIQYRLGQRLQVAKPVIAAINGYCLAGGLELALGCDIRIASETASFGCPEVRWAILHGFGAMRLPSTVPMSVAMEMLLTGERIDAARALEIGLVSRVVPRAELLASARDLADRLCAGAPLAVRAVKEMAYRGQEMHWTEAVRFGETLRRYVANTDDAREGMRATSEGRAPVWTGH